MAKEYAEKKQGELLGIFGLPGTGKTRLRLLHAVTNFWIKDRPEERVAFYPKGALTEKLEKALENDRFLFKEKESWLEQ